MNYRGKIDRGFTVVAIFLTSLAYSFIYLMTPYQLHMLKSTKMAKISLEELRKTIKYFMMAGLQTDIQI
jgi:hypothetical protein